MLSQYTIKNPNLQKMGHLGNSGSTDIGIVLDFG